MAFSTSRAVPDAPKNSRFLRACRAEPVDVTPVWFMRQAGRYLPEYRAVREKHSLLEICKTPALAAEVTITAAERLDVDAAIIFADLLLPVEPMGMRLRFEQGEGPVLENPLRDEAAVARLRSDVAPELGYVSEAIRRVRQHFGGRLPVIGFAGGPFTLASYMIEGGGSRNFVATKTLLYQAPQAWARLMEKLCEALEPYLLSQVEAGADAVQLFDSWAGCLSVDDYGEYVLPYSERLIGAVQARGVPVIHFATESASLLVAMQRAGAAVLSVDWRIRLDEAWARVGYRPAIQGNLDPTALLAPLPELRRRIRAILEQAGRRPRPHLQPGARHFARDPGGKCDRRRANGPGIFARFPAQRFRTRWINRQPGIGNPRSAIRNPQSRSGPVLLLAHGAPDRLEDIPEFLRHVRGGRPLSDRAVQEISERYAPHRWVFAAAANYGAAGPRPGSAPWGAGRGGHAELEAVYRRGAGQPAG